MKSRTDKVLLVLLALVFFLRVVFFVQFHATPFYTHPILDAAIYDDAAKQVATGNLIQDRAFFMSPMYPFLLGGLYRLFGPGPASPRIFQMLLGLVACGLIFIYTGRIADRWTALITAGLYAFYAPILFYEQTLLMESSMAFAVILFMFILYLSMGSRRPGWASVQESF
ncbi:MAG TPA: glycosyltransferase family 39 protein [Candidatus Sumerlaeota bacterium]|nr:glycosyltransferase family 39 protein [Candidatus Sumerlaeota bacterium]